MYSEYFLLLWKLQSCYSTSCLLLSCTCIHIPKITTFPIISIYSFQMQFRWELMLYKWPYSLLVYLLEIWVPTLCFTYGMYKYFMKNFEGLGKIHVTDFQKNESINTWKDVKMLKRLQNLQSLIHVFFIFGVEKLWNSITCLMNKCMGQIYLKKEVVFSWANFLLNN